MVFGRFSNSDRGTVHGDGFTGDSICRKKRRNGRLRGGERWAIFSHQLLEAMAMVMTVYVMVDMRRERRGGKGEAV